VAPESDPKHLKHLVCDRAVSGGRVLNGDWPRLHWNRIEHHAQMMSILSEKSPATLTVHVERSASTNGLWAARCVGA
jgi:hypothetical protein